MLGQFLVMLSIETNLVSENVASRDVTAIVIATALPLVCKHARLAQLCQHAAMTRIGLLTAADIVMPSMRPSGGAVVPK